MLKLERYMYVYLGNCFSTHTGGVGGLLPVDDVKGLLSVLDEQDRLDLALVNQGVQDVHILYVQHVQDRGVARVCPLKEATKKRPGLKLEHIKFS